MIKQHFCSDLARFLTKHLVHIILYQLFDTKYASKVFLFCVEIRKLSVSAALPHEEIYLRLHLDLMIKDRRLFIVFTFNEKLGLFQWRRCYIFENFLLSFFIYSYSLNHPIYLARVEENFLIGKYWIECGSQSLGYLQLIRNFISSGKFGPRFPEKSISIRKRKFANFSSSLLCWER